MPFTPDHFTVWMEIPVTDMERAVAYYNAVCDADLAIDTSGPNPMATFPFKDGTQSVAGHLYPGKPPAPGTGPTIHLAVPGALEAAMERVAAAGGQVVSPPITIPPGRFAYTLDPDGNSVGIFETV